jgi:hypothetical protein
MSTNALSSTMVRSANAWFSVSTLPLLVMPSSMFASTSRMRRSALRELKVSTIARVVAPINADTTSMVSTNLRRNVVRCFGGTMDGRIDTLRTGDTSIETSYGPIEGELHSRGRLFWM